MKIAELNLSVHAYSCLKRAGINTVEQLREVPPDELGRIRNMTQRSLAEIKEAISVAHSKTADEMFRELEFQKFRGNPLKYGDENGTTFEYKPGERFFPIEIWHSGECLRMSKEQLFALVQLVKEAENEKV